MPEPDVPLHEASRFFNRIEEAFQEALDASLDSRGPDSLYDLIGHLGLPRSATVVDVGCGKGAQAVDLANRFGFNVVGVDPVPRHELASRAAQARAFSARRTERLSGGSLCGVPSTERGTYPALVRTEAQPPRCRVDVFGDVADGEGRLSLVMRHGGLDGVVLEYETEEPGLEFGVGEAFDPLVFEHE